MTRPLAVWLMILAAATARADDWPQRGARPGEALAPGVAPAWSVDLGERVVAGAVIADGVVVVVTEGGRAVALDEATGAPRWSRDLGAPGCTSTPACARGRVVVARGDGHVVCLALETGAVLWSRPDEGGPRGAVAIAGDLVVVALGFPSLRVEALGLEQGDLRWAVDLPQPSYAHPAIGPAIGAAIGPDRVVIGGNDGAYEARALADGALLWRYPTTGRVLLSGAALDADSALLLPGGADARVHRVDLDPTRWAATNRTIALADPSPPTPAWAIAGTAVSGGPPSRVGALAVVQVRFDHTLDEAEPWGQSDRFVCHEGLAVVDPVSGAFVRWIALASVDAPSQNAVPPFGHAPSPLVLVGPDGTWLLVTPSLEARASFVRVDGTAGPSRSRGAGERWASASSPAAANARLVLVTGAGVVDALSLAGGAPAAPQVTGATTPDPAQAKVTWTFGADPDDPPASLTAVVRLDDDGEVLLDWLHEVTTGPGVTEAAPPAALTPGRTYTARVRARDPAGAWSPWSSAADVVLDLVPAPPTALLASGGPQQVTVAWDPSPTTWVTSYVVRSRERGALTWDAPRDVGLALTATLQQVVTGRTYEVQVTAASAQGRESAPAQVEASAQDPVTIGGAPFPTLLAALAAARPGDVVTLGAGTIAVDGPLVLPTGVTLRGTSAWATRLVATPGRDALLVRGRGVRLERLALSGARRGVVAEPGAELTLDHVLLTRHDDALVVEHGARVEAVHVTIGGNAGRGARVEAGGALDLVSSILTRNDLGLDALGPARTRWSAVAGNTRLDRQGDVPLDPTDGAAPPLLRDPEHDDWRERSSSPTVDAGDPLEPIAAEPAPHGSRVNQGAFGGTEQAATTPLVVASNSGSSGGGCALSAPSSAPSAACWPLLALCFAVVLARRRA